MASDHHQPAPPRVPEPPAVIRRLSETIRHPGVASTGLTATSQGEWALLVNVEGDVPLPISEIEAKAEGHPVVYVRQYGLPIARPAYPGQGE